MFTRWLEKFVGFVLIIVNAAAGVLLMTMVGKAIGGHPEWGDWQVALVCAAILILSTAGVDRYIRHGTATEAQLRGEMETLKWGIADASDRLWSHWMPMDQATRNEWKKVRERGIELAHSRFDVVLNPDESLEFFQPRDALEVRKATLEEILDSVERCNHELNSLRLEWGRQTVNVLFGSSTVGEQLLATGMMNRQLRIVAEFMVGSSQVVKETWTRILTAQTPENASHEDWHALEIYKLLTDDSLAAQLEQFKSHNEN